jgi:hypothetical protein
LKPNSGASDSTSFPIRPYPTIRRFIVSSLNG